MNKWNLETHGHRLHNLGYCAPRLSEFNYAIKQKIISIGEAVPDAALTTALFGDGTRLRTAIPGVGTTYCLYFFKKTISL